MKILPVFLVTWIAKRKCEEVQWGANRYATAFKDVLIEKTE